jgi:hypothetical protein
MLTKNCSTFFCSINNQSTLFFSYEFALSDCFRISLIFHAILIFWSWYHSSTSSRNFASVSFNTQLRSVFAWSWIFFYRFSIVVRFLLCSLMTIFSEVFHIIAACVRSTLKLHVDVIFARFDQLTLDSIVKYINQRTMLVFYQSIFDDDLQRK